MKLVLDDELLRALRHRRNEQRAALQGRVASRATFSASAADWFRRRLRSRSSISRVMADEFVGAMDELQQEVEDEYDAFLLDPGMGPMIYLTSDGRVLLDFRSWDGDEVREATEDEAIGALVVGAKKTGLPKLLDLIPPPPEEGMECPMCHGARWARLHPEWASTMVCITCSGRGWIPPTGSTRP